MTSVCAFSSAACASSPRKVWRASPDRGYEPGPHDRGLAAPRRAHDGEERGPRQAAGEVRDELLPPEEELGVLRLEGLEALVRESHVAAERRVVGRLLVERAGR